MHQDAETEVMPEWVSDEIANPVAMGEGRNNQMIRIGPALIRRGFDLDGLFELFCGMYPDIGEKQEREIHAVCRNSAKLAAREELQIDKTKFAAMRSRLDRVAGEARRALPGILEDYRWTLAEIREAGAIQLGLREQRKAFLAGMFASDDIVWVGMTWQSGEKKRHGKLIGGRWEERFKEASHWLGLKAIAGEFCSHCTFKPGAWSRCNDSVMERKFLVAESDALGMDEVGAVFNYLVASGLVLRACVTSGNKSLHGWFDYPGDDFIEDWSAVLTGLRCDPSTLRASQPVRLPGCVRKNTRKPQELVYFSPRPTLIES